MLNKLISKVKGLFIKDNIITEDIKNEIVEVNTKTKELNLFDIVKSENNRENHTCIDLVCQIKKELNIDTLNYITHENVTISDKKEYKIENEMDLYYFYKDNMSDENVVPNKTITSKRLNVSISTITRMNNKLKEKDLLYTVGKSLILKVKEDIINE